MKTLLIIKGGRPIPNSLVEHCNRGHYKAEVISPTKNGLISAFQKCDAVLLPTPIRHRREYLDASALWFTFLKSNYAEKRFLLYGYESVQHPVYLDVLQLSTIAPSYWDAIPTVKEIRSLPKLSGVDLQDRLQRFFAGHGQDSVVAVLTRIRLVVQMASRELQKMQTPYAEIYRELVAPAQLEKKWADWRNRWINYAPLFEFSPFAAKLQQIGIAAKQVEPWMQSGGMAEQPLQTGTTLQTLNFIREELYKIENQYVVQKLSHSHR